jgi:hypothetical protein
LTTIDEDGFGNTSEYTLGLFKRFSPVRTTCIFCPPGRKDPFILRIIWRGLLPLLLLGRRQINGFLFLLLIIPALVYGLVVESLIETIAGAKENMNTLFSAIVVLVLVLVPTYLMSQRPESYSAPVQLMFSVFLTAASTWFGVSINNKRARREATGKWLPAAETACKTLLTLSVTAERMKRTQAQACSAIEPVVADSDQNVVKPVKALIDLQCRETAEKLATLRDHIENAISTWQLFIGTNCEGEECALIDERLQVCRQQLFSQIEASAQPCPHEEPANVVSPS